MGTDGAKRETNVGYGDLMGEFIIRKRIENCSEQTLDSYEKSLGQWVRSGLPPVEWLGSLTCAAITKHKMFRIASTVSARGAARSTRLVGKTGPRLFGTASSARCRQAQRSGHLWAACSTRRISTVFALIR